MIRIEFDRDDNFELLLEAIGYERITSMDMELRTFLSDITNGVFSKGIYRLTASQDMMAHLEVNPKDQSIILELHPRAKSVDASLKEITDAYFSSKNTQGVVDPDIFSSKISKQAAKGVKAWLQKYV